MMAPKRPIDAELAALATLLPEIDLRDPEGAREIERTIIGELRRSSRADDYERIQLRRPDGSELSVALHRPSRPKATGGPIPVLVFLHGGGFIMGGLHTERERCAQYAEAAKCAVVSVDYRLAPEARFPAALEDCLAVLDWLGREADVHGFDRERVAIGGLSAGGALAAATVLCLRDSREGVPQTPDLPLPGDGAFSVRLVLQMLLFPVLDASMTTVSAREYTDTPILKASMLPVMWHHYLGDRGEVPRWASPSSAQNLTGCPPAFIAIAQFDPLRDEGLHFAQRLLSAGVPVGLHLYSRTYHSFDTFHTTRMGQVARQHQAEVLTAAFR
ncbi:alpha/beta hydrolase [Micromonospora sp. NPDC048830]|uniref:alpha/beta hydrolase n=1 Tax=Micromonospora sp. NPDC048830 TaxID=3364257 RepID=UPI003710FBE3